MSYEGGRMRRHALVAIARNSRPKPAFRFAGRLACIDKGLACRSSRASNGSPIFAARRKLVSKRVTQNEIVCNGGARREGNSAQVSTPQAEISRPKARRGFGA